MSSGVTCPGTEEYSKFFDMKLTVTDEGKILDGYRMNYTGEQIHSKN